MADTVNKLRRGIKLLREHIYTPVQSYLTKVSTAQVSASDLKKERGSFRLTLHIPGFDYAQSVKGMTVPFVLPPLQDYFSPVGASNRPTVRLEEVTIGFDQMGANTGVKFGRHNNTAAPTLENNSKLNIGLSIKSKERDTLSYAPYIDVVWSTELDAANFQATTKRSNPVAFTGLKTSINQNKSYAVAISAPDLEDAAVGANSLALWSLTVSLRFSHDLVPRDTGTLIQNIPSAHDGAKAVSAANLVLPASDGAIQADTATGVSTAFEWLDLYVRGKLRGGYRKDSTRQDTIPYESILDDAGYEIIAVPMFGNMLDIAGGTHGGAVGGNGLTPNTELPYTAATFANTGEFMDRRIIPLQYPVVVHHVIAAVNMSWHGDGNQKTAVPTSATFSQIVGVGLGSGLRGQKLAYTTVAGAQWVPGASKQNLLIDTISDTRSSSAAKNYLWELISIPILHDTSNFGTGYKQQGKPFYAGRAIDNPKTPVSGYTVSTSDRRNVGTGSGSGAPPTAGYENFIEVRWSIQDGGVGGVDNAAWNSATVGSVTTHKPIVGFGGNWVYLICKKHLI